MSVSAVSAAGGSYEHARVSAAPIYERCLRSSHLCHRLLPPGSTPAIARWWCVPLLLVLVAALVGRDAKAACDIIPPAKREFRSSLGSISRPFAKPGDLVDISLDPVCHSLSPGFSDRTEDHVVTLVFTPPGGPVNVVVLSSGDADIQEQVDQCEQLEEVAAVRWMRLPIDSPSLIALSPRALRFRFPDTDDAVAAPDDDLTFAGPVRIAVSRVGQSLPCGLASRSCAAQPDVLACIDFLFADSGTCAPSADPIFRQFTALPPPNDYASLCREPMPPCTPVPLPKIRFALDSEGNALIPMDWRAVLVDRDAVPVARLLRGAVTTPAFEASDDPLRLTDGRSLASYSPEGVKLPPVFDPQVDLEDTSSSRFFGTADAPETVLRLARRHGTCAGGDRDALVCSAAPDCPLGTCLTSCVADPSVFCNSDADCPSGRCGRLFDFQSRLVERAGPARFDVADVVALDPVPLDGLNQTADLNAFVLEEAIVARDLDGDGVPDVGDLNADGDYTDHVITLADRRDGVLAPIGGAGESARALVRLHEPPFNFPALAAEQDLVAFLEGENTQGNIDSTGNGSTIDTVLRVYRVGDGEVTDLLPGQNIPVSAEPVLDGRSIAISSGRLFFRQRESLLAPVTTEHVSVRTDGAQIPRAIVADISTEGRVVAFRGTSDRVRPNGSRVFSAFVRDRVAQITEPVAVLSPCGACGPGVSHDCCSARSGPGCSDPEIAACVCGTDPFCCTSQWDGLCASQVTAQEAAEAFDPSMSGDGRRIAYLSGERIVAGASHSACELCDDVYVYDRQERRTIRASQSSEGKTSEFLRDGIDSFGADVPVISQDGRTVAFFSDARNLVRGDTNGCSVTGFPRIERNCPDIFVHDLDTRVTTRVSVDSNGDQGFLGGKALLGSLLGVDLPDLSADGRFVVFSSDFINLDRANYDREITTENLYIHDRKTGRTTALNVDEAQGNRILNAGAFSFHNFLGVSGDGRYVIFEGFDGDLPGDTNGRPDIFLKDRVAGTVRRLPVHALDQDEQFADSYAALSSDGRYVAFNSISGTNVPGDDNAVGDVFVHDVLTEQTARVSVSPSGGQGNGPSGGFLINNGGRSSYESFAISPDGGSIAFDSIATNLVAGDANGDSDVFVRGPIPGVGDRTGDGDALDSILHVLDIAAGETTPIPLCPATVAAVTGGNVAFLRPEDGGRAFDLAFCPPPEATSGIVDLNEDGDDHDAVVHVWTGGVARNLSKAATAVALSASWIAALVSERGEGNQSLNGDDDTDDDVAAVHPLSGGDWANLGWAADSVAVVGSIVAFISSESAQGGSDANGDGDVDDRVLVVYRASAPGTPLVGPPSATAAKEFVVGGSPGREIVAFRTSETAEGRTDLNDDGDHDDDVLQIFDAETGAVVNTGLAVTPCRLEACDPRFPYRVLDDTVRFLTLESDQGEDLNGDGDRSDIVLQVFNVRKACHTGSSVGACHSLAATPAGVCTSNGAACTFDSDCGSSGRCFVPPGGCALVTAETCDPNPCRGCEDQTCATGQFCQPLAGHGAGVCVTLLDRKCSADSDCKQLDSNAICNGAAQDFHRIADPLRDSAGAGASVVVGTGRCVEALGTACSASADCAAGEFCEDQQCRRDQGACAADHDCPGAISCRKSLVAQTAADRDGDEVPDAFDNCPDDANVRQDDEDSDGVGDECDLETCGNGVREFDELCDDGNLNPDDGCDCTISICAGEAVLSGGEVRLSGLGIPAPDSLTLRGRIELSEAAADGLDLSKVVTLGAQVIVEDFGAAGRPVVDLSLRTTPIPGGAVGSGCDTKDGWRATRDARRVTYLNHSNRLPASCAAKSARGVRRLAFSRRRETPGRIDVELQIRKAGLGTVVGPLRATVILGAALSASSELPCGRASALDCRPTEKSRLVCR